MQHGSDPINGSQVLGKRELTGNGIRWKNEESSADEETFDGKKDVERLSQLDTLGKNRHRQLRERMTEKQKGRGFEHTQRQVAWKLSANAPPTMGPLTRPTAHDKPNMAIAVTASTEDA